MASQVEIQSEGSRRDECGPTSSSSRGGPPSLTAPRPAGCILVGVRPNLRGQETLDYVFSKIARKSDRVVILHILQAVPSLPPLSMENAETSKVLENAWWDVHRQKISDEVSHLLRPYKRICREKKIEAQIRIIHNSNVEKTLVQEAATLRATKLVIGSSDRAKIGGCNLPRCTMFKKETGPYHYIMKHAPEGCNVLVVGDGQLLHRSRRPSSSKVSCFKGENGKLFPIPIPGTSSEPPKSFVTFTTEKVAKKSSPIKGASSIHNFGRHTAKIIFSLSDGHSRRFSPSRFQFKDEDESPYHNMAKGKNKGKGKGSPKTSNRMAASDILYPIENSMMDDSANKDGRCLSEGQRNQRYPRYDQHDEDLVDDAESHSTELNPQLFRTSPNSYAGLRNDVILEEPGEGVEEAGDLIVPNYGEEPVVSVHVKDEASFRQRWIEGEEVVERGEMIGQATGFEFDQTDIQFGTRGTEFYSSPEISFGRSYEENLDSSPIFHSDAISLKSQCEMEDDESMMTHSIRSYQLYASTVGQSSTNLTSDHLECGDDTELENPSEFSGIIPQSSDDVGCSSQITELTTLEEELLERITDASDLPRRLTPDVRSWDDSGVGMKNNAWFVTAMVRAKLVPNEGTFFHSDQLQASSLAPNQTRISRVFSRELKRSTTTNLPLLHLGNLNLESDLRRVDQACADNMNLLTMEVPETTTVSYSLNSPRSIVNGTDFFSGSTKSASSLMIMRAGSKSSSSTSFSPLQLKTILEMMRETEEEAKRSTPSPSPSPTPSHSPSPSYIPLEMNFSSPHRRIESVEDVPQLTRRPSLPIDNPLIKTSSLQKGSTNARYFHFEELAYATNGFVKENMIGKGGYAYVFKGILPGGRRIAVKRLLKKGKEVDFLTEVGVVSHVRHPHATVLLGYCIESSHRLLVYDLMVHGSLERNLHGKRKFMNWGRRMKAAIGSAKGLDYLHRICPHRIIHRDVKSANILIGSNWNAQISDFGLAKWVPDTKTFSSNGPIEGTFGYMAPEYFMQGELNEKTDVYAFGVVLLEIITGRRPIDIRRPISEQNLVAWAVPRLESWRVDEFIDPKLGDDFDVVQLRRVCAAALLCLRVCPDYRPSMNEITELLECRAFSENQWQDIWEDLVEKKGGTGQIQRYSSIGAEYTDSMYKRDLQNHMALALALSIGQTETN